MTAGIAIVLAKGLVGGVFVAAFALIGESVQPKSFSPPRHAAVDGEALTVEVVPAQCRQLCTATADYRREAQRQAGCRIDVTRGGDY